MLDILQFDSFFEENTEHLPLRLDGEDQDFFDDSDHNIFGLAGNIQEK